MNQPLDFPFVAKDHIATLAALTKDEAGCWITLVAHCWHAGPLTSEFAVRLVGEQQFEQVRFLMEMEQGLFSFPWLETARKRKEKRSLQNSANGKKGGRGNKRGNKGPRPLPSPPPRTGMPSAPVEEARRPARSRKELSLFPPEKFTWPKWAGEKVQAKWQDFKRARWEKHHDQYESIVAEQNAIDLMGTWYTSGTDCHKALVVATSKQWKSLVDPALLAANSYANKVPVADAAAIKGGLDPDKIKSWLK